ncbi:hypothetical protein ZOSMA_50G00130 [Zostera marina]|uniref:AP2/ERF domain-containing protein n=1 Tax=Zostera marina TaxID=29655 RepID=A0A0K9NXZ7_ZOSMR|nr:hypothetical protein ZOSMA_50G00130 [Zostera marina]
MEEMEKGKSGSDMYRSNAGSSSSGISSSGSSSETKKSGMSEEKKKKKKKRKIVARERPSERSSVYRGVTRHRWTGRYEAHLWDKNCWNLSQSKKGRQVYLGAYNDEKDAANAYDLAAIKYWGQDTLLNFPVNK